MRRLYDADRRRLVYLDQPARREFWDRHWRSDNLGAAIRGPRNWPTVTATRRFLPVGSRILEGGCGCGDKVFALRRAGFEAVGVDFAEETVVLAKAAVPELDILVGDVRALPFDDATFDGYWSLGVIEHFFEGYYDIAGEMSRVLRPQGFLFLAFPTMSMLRRLKVWLHRYEPLGSDRRDLDKFFQFALDADQTFRSFERLGFRVLETRKRGGLVGLQDEVSFGLLDRAMAFLMHGGGLPRKLARYTADLGVRWLANYSILGVLRKENAGAPTQ